MFDANTALVFENALVIIGGILAVAASVLIWLIRLEMKLKSHLEDCAMRTRLSRIDDKLDRIDTSVDTLTSVVSRLEEAVEWLKKSADKR